MAHLDEDYKDTLDLVRTLRKAVAKKPVVAGALNPSARLLNSEQLHLRGLARLRGPKNVEVDIAEEFRQAARMGKALTAEVAIDPVSPVTTLLRDTQTHIRGCAQILANAHAEVAPKGNVKYDELFQEPPTVPFSTPEDNVPTVVDGRVDVGARGSLAD